MHDLSSRCRERVLQEIEPFFASQAPEELASMDCVQEVALDLCRAVTEVFFAAWTRALLVYGRKLASLCPGCGRPRRCKLRKKSPMRIQVLGLTVDVPNPYLQCAHCKGKGCSVIKLLTGLRDGDVSTELALRAAYCAAYGSYRVAQRDLLVHTGQEVERAKLRRLSLEVESEAVSYAAAEREHHLAAVAAEGHRDGVARLMLEADGGKVRTGELKDITDPKNPGFGVATTRKDLKRRRRETTFREVMGILGRECASPARWKPAA